MWGHASTTAAIVMTFGQTGVVIVSAVTAVLAAWAGLAGLGFGLDRVRWWILNGGTGWEEWEKSKIERI